MNCPKYTAWVFLPLLMFGCNSQSGDYRSTKEVKETAPNGHSHESHGGGHVHYGAGPHGGSIIELGGDDYHAEFVIDHDAHALRVFLLKSDAKTPLLIEAKQVSLALDAGKQVTLTVAPNEGESEGQSSKFEVVDEDLIHELMKQGFLHGDLSVRIGEKAFSAHLDIHFEHGDSKPDHQHDQPKTK